MSPSADAASSLARVGNAFDLAAPALSEGGARVVDDNIVVRTPPEPWAYAAVWSRTDVPRETLQGVRLVVRVRAREGRFTVLVWSGSEVLAEVFVDEAFGWEELDIAVPTLGPDAQIIVRTADLAGSAIAEITSLEVFTGYDRTTDPAFKNHFPDLSDRTFVPATYRTTPSFLVYQPGKVASITIEKSILLSDPWAEVQRHHFLNKAYVDRFRHACAIETENRDLAAAVQSLADRAHDAISAIRRSKNPIWVITGFRDPLSFAIAAFFQNLQQFCPSIVCDENELDRETDAALEEFNVSFEALIERRRDHRTAETIRDIFLEKKLSNIADWFDRELKGTFGIDLSAIDMDDRPYVHIADGRFRFTIYRYEDLREHLPDLIGDFGLRGRVRTETLNVAEDKPIGKIYKSFKQRFRATPEMVDFYYGSPFFARFYRGRRPAFS